MRGLPIIILLLAYINCFGSEITRQLDHLISKGNRAYEMSQPSQIKLYADSISHILSSGEFKGDELADYSLSNLKLYGNYHYEKGNLDSALYYYHSAQNLISSHPNTAFKSNGVLLMLRELAQLYYRLENYNDALTAMEEADEILEFDQPYLLGDNNWIITKLSYAMCLARLENFDKALEIAEKELKQAKDKNSLEYAKAQRMYAKILLLAEANAKGALKAYQDYFKTQKEYAIDNFSKMNAIQREEYWHNLQPFIRDCYNLEGVEPGFLYDITLFSKGLLLQLNILSGDGPASKDALKTLEYSWKDIQRKLKPGNAAIEFIQYGEGQNQKMAALMLKNKGKPIFISLTPPEVVLERIGNDLSSTSRKNKDRLYSDTVVSNLVWTNTLCEELKGIERIYFSPDGYFHRYAIEYLPQVKNIDLYRLSSTRKLMDQKRGLPKNASLLAFGGVNYNYSPPTNNISNNDTLAYFNYIGKYFPNLSEDTNETKVIIKERHNPKDSLLYGSQASEEAFRNLAPNFDLILLSTHGDFSDKSDVSTDLKPTTSDGLLSKNIVSFAGVNQNLIDKGFNPANSFDGLLSAAEISTLPLENCRLFTASACQTALGDISSDGVFGLQRGLKNAGVDAMLLSLWNVNAESTAALMTEFYSLLNKGESIRTAFMKARDKLMNNEPSERKLYVFDPTILAGKEILVKDQNFNTPQFTDAFILIDAID